MWVKQDRSAMDRQTHKTLPGGGIQNYGLGPRSLGFRHRVGDDKSEDTTCRTFSTTAGPLPSHYRTMKGLSPSNKVPGMMRTVCCSCAMLKVNVP